MHTLLLLTFLAQNLGDNAALRYWSAFSHIQQESITPEISKSLNAVLTGKTAYASASWKPLLDNNRAALATLHRAARLDACDWGIDYALGSNAPIDYVRKALALGRLNALLAFEQKNQRAAALSTVATGLRFAQHTAQGGTLFAALAAKFLMLAHLEALGQLGPLRPEEKAALPRVDIDWLAALRREADVALPAAQAPLKKLYLDAIANPDTLPQLDRALAQAPPEIASRLPRVRKVIEEKNALRTAFESIR